MNATAEFAKALLDPHGPTPAGLRAWNGSDPKVRLDVYRNNVVSSLTQTLADTFSVVCEMVGADFFRTMAHGFVLQQPPRSPVMSEYGAGFADFISHYAPAVGLPYLPDLARLEWAKLLSLHAADADALPHAQWASLLAQPEQLVRCRFSLHPSVFVLRSEHAVASLWAAHQGLLDIAGVDPSQPEAAIIFRPDDDVRVMPISHATASWLLSLQAGQSLGTASEKAAQLSASDDVDFDLAAAVQVLVGHGMVTACVTTETITTETSS